MTEATRHAMFVRRRHALGAGLALLVVAGVLTFLVARDPGRPAIQGIDDRWQDWMIDGRSPALTRVGRVLSVVGGPLVMLPLRVVVVGALAWTRRWLQLTAFAAAVVTSELCIGPLKAALDRPRPLDSLVTSDSAAFPSGHAIAASVTAIGLVVVFAPAFNRRAHWTAIAVGFATLMAMSRTYLGAHWASDVVAGVCIGAGLAIAWAAALELARDRFEARAGLAVHGIAP
jgi:membrane-associated phospholipid phosphatase